jgi:asparagine synthase (glutamine-hydrolysing)
MHLGIKQTLQTADGIFAFAFYDVQKNALVLARDRVGIKPLYMGHSQQGIVYSSQYDHIINHPYFKNESINVGAIGAFLSLGYVPENAGAINKTRLLLHGHYYIIENGDVTPHKYYDYPLAQTGAENNLDDVLSTAVQSQLVSDVPLGTFMSGGVDSTLVTYFANKQTSINSFTIGIRGHDLDESGAAKQFADIFKTQHHCKFISPVDLLHLINDNTKAFSEPFADFSSLPTLVLSKFAREKVTVALSGDGGDELFWGYPRNIAALKNIKFYQGPALARKARLLAAKISNRSAFTVSRHWKEKSFLSYYYHTLFITGALHWMKFIFKHDALEDYYYTLQTNTGNRLNYTDDYMNVARKLEIDIHLQRILLKVDRASMYHSLEVRVPLLSNSVLDESAAYNFSICIKNGQGKMNLKESLAKKTNSQLVLKPKKGFVIPMSEWMRTELKADVTEKLLDMPSHLAIMFNKNQVENMLNMHMNNGADLGWFIWAVYSLVNWDACHRNNKNLIA